MAPGEFPPVPSEDPQRRSAELAKLYEVARALIGARDRGQVASRAVLSGMGALGARSGALFAADEHGRYRLLFAAGLGAAAPGESLLVPLAAREWMLRQGVFPLPAAGTARALAGLRERLVEDYDAAVGTAVADAAGLQALLVFGPRLLAGEFDEGDRTLLEALASLASQALEAHPMPARAAPARRAPPRLETSLAALRRAYPPLQTMVGESTALIEVCRDLVTVAGTRFPVLLTGDSGVGKELAARALHELSGRAAGPFEVVDCGSIPRELIESEMFGHVRGAFTGAHRDRRGAFQLAHRGTLFLDEIGEMPLQLQTRLLRFLQEGRFRRVGDESMLEVDVRVVTATNRDLRASAAAGRFREDLFYRLNVYSIRIPPLRERMEDLVPLLRHFLILQGRELGVPEWAVDADVLAALDRHSWPGNVRELMNLTAALTVQTRSSGHITLEDLERVWRRQHAGEEPPWTGTVCAARGRRGAWVLDLARASRFNLVEAARTLQRWKRAGQAVPVSERSALSYYLVGEILQALAENGGEVEAAARALAGRADLVALVEPRVRKVVEALCATGRDHAALRRRFGKLPAGYEEALARAATLVGGQ